MMRTRWPDILFGLLVVAAVLLTGTSAPEKPEPPACLIIVGREGCAACRRAQQDASKAGVPYAYVEADDLARWYWDIKGKPGRAKPMPQFLLWRDGKLTETHTGRMNETKLRLWTKR